MRKELKLLRVKNNLTQAEMAKVLGVSRVAYGYYETGTREGRQKFWTTLQRKFNLSDEEMYKMMKND